MATKRRKYGNGGRYEEYADSQMSENERKTMDAIEGTNFMGVPVGKIAKGIGTPFRNLGIRMGDKDGMDAYFANKDAQLVQDRIQDSEAQLAYYPINGVQDSGFARGGKMRAYGGGLPSVAEGGSKVGISSDAAVYKGKSHEEGGIDLNNGVEIEGEEVVQKDRVFSDRLKPTTKVKEIAKLQGIKISDSDTFASISEKLLRKKGKFEDESTDPVSIATSKAMTGRIDGILDLVFADQQSLNGNSKGTKKMYGGGIDPNNKTPKFKTQEEHNAYYTNTLVERMKKENQALYTKYQESLATNNIADIQTTLAAAGGIPVFVPEKTQPTNPTDWKNMEFTNKSPKGYRYGARGGEGLPAKGSITKRKYAYGGDDLMDGQVKIVLDNEKEQQPSMFWDNLSTSNTPEWNANLFNGAETTTPETGGAVGSPPAYNPDAGKSEGGGNKSIFSDLVNIGGTVASQLAINKMKTKTPARTILKPGFSYTDLSKPAYRRNSMSYREAALAAARSGRDSNALNASLYSAKLTADADVAAAESSRRQTATDSYLNRVAGVDATNANILSQNDFYNTQRYNEKVGLTQQNIDNFVKGVIGNQTNRDLMSLDKDKAKLIASLAGNRGIVERMKTDPELRETLKRLLGE